MTDVITDMWTFYEMDLGKSRKYISKSSPKYRENKKKGRKFWVVTKWNWYLSYLQVN